MTRMETLLTAIQAKYSDVLAIYLTGSQLLGVSKSASDYDFVVITKIQPTQLLIASPMSGQDFFMVDDMSVDLKWYSSLKLAKMLIKSGFPVLEYLSVPPIFHTKDYDAMLSDLNDEQLRVAYQTFHVRGLVNELKARYGQLYQLILKTDLDMTAISKKFFYLLRYHQYMMDLLYFGYIHSVQDVPLHHRAFLTDLEADRTHLLALWHDYATENEKLSNRVLERYPDVAHPDFSIFNHFVTV